MKTFLPKQSEITRKWLLIDAEGKNLGEIAVEIANILRGKNKPTFTPHLDTGDFVVIINASKVTFSSESKWDQKKYYSHSGYLGGLKEISARRMKEEKPTEVLRNAIAGMIPKTKTKKDILKRLRIFSEANHDHEAQKPEIVKL